MPLYEMVLWRKRNRSDDRVYYGIPAHTDRRIYEELGIVVLPESYYRTGSAPHISLYPGFLGLHADDMDSIRRVIDGYHKLNNIRVRLVPRRESK